MRKRSGVVAGAASEPPYEQAVAKVVEDCNKKFCDVVLGPPEVYAAGDVLTVTWGKETFRPLQYHVLDLGPFSATTRVRPGETMQSAAERAFAELEAIATAEFERKIRAFTGRARMLDEMMRSQRKGG